MPRPRVATTPHLVDPIGRRNLWLITLATCAFCFLFFHLGLGLPALWDPDEGRYAAAARDMLTTGGWLAPTYNQLPDHHKPILFYWLVAASMRVFGTSEWAARLPSALAATVCVAATAWWGARFVSAAVGILAAAILASAGLFVAAAHLAIIDMTFAALLSGALLSAGSWCLDGEGGAGPRWHFWVLLSLASLAKGPVAFVLAALCLIPFCWRRGIRIDALDLLRGALIALATAGTWYVAIAIVHPDYFRDFLWLHNVDRFLRGDVGHRMNPFAYLYLLPLCFLPWSLLLPLVPLHWHQRAGERASEMTARDFCLAWVLTVFGFFSCSTTKLGTYLLPAFPALALLLSRAIVAGVQDLPERRETGIYAFALRAILVLQIGGALTCAAALLWLHVPNVSLAALALSGIPFTLWGLRLLAQGRRESVVAAIAAAMTISCAAFYLLASPALTDALSLKRAALAVRALVETPRVVAFNARFQSLSYYLATPVRVAQSVDEAVDALCGEPATVVLTKRNPASQIAARAACDVATLWSGERDKVLLSNRRL